MKNRDKQRHNRRIKQELLDSKNAYGVNDPTPREAVKKIVREFIKHK